MARFDTKPFEQQADNSPYETVIELHPNDSKIPVLIRAAKNVETPMLWQVIRRGNEFYFSSFGETSAFCKERGWM